MIGRVLGGVAAAFGLLLLAKATVFGLSDVQEAGIGLMAAGVSLAFC
jgi:hypothetical protein